MDKRFTEKRLTDFVCYEVHRLHGVNFCALFKPLEGVSDPETTFGLMGSHPRNNEEDWYTVSLSELPSVCKHVWSRKYKEFGDHTALYKPTDHTLIRELEERFRRLHLGQESHLNQIALLRVPWTGRDHDPRFMICGVTNPVLDSPHFNLKNLARIRGLVEYLSAYTLEQWVPLQQDLKKRRRSAFDAMKQARSRTALIQAAHELIWGEWPFVELLSYAKDHLVPVGRDQCLVDQLDEICGTYCDMRTSLEIVPDFVRRDSLPRKDLETAEAQQISTEGVISISKHRLPTDLGQWKGFEHTRLALLRWECYEALKDFQPTKDDYLTYYRELLADTEYNHFVYDLDEKGNPRNWKKNNAEFSKENQRTLERLRTGLFCLHHASRGLHPRWGRLRKSHRYLLPVEDISKLLFLTRDVLWDFLTGNFDGQRLTITSDWLAGWFGFVILSEGLPEEILENAFHTPNETAVFHKHLTCYLLYLLHWMKYEGDSTRFVFGDVQRGFQAVIESKIYLIAEYAHVKLGLPRCVPLFDTLRQMWACEALLYTAQDAYREHMHHAIDTCLIGLLMIDSGLLHILSPNQLSNSDTVKELKRNWILAGLLHDVGYGLRLNQEILKQIKFLEHSPLIRNYLEQLSTVLKDQENRLVEQINEKVREELPGFSQRIKRVHHGIVSALLVESMQRNFITQELDNSWRISVANAHRAIANHDLPGEQIDPHEEPLSFLLLLCDHLQEWDRPRVDPFFRHHLAAYLIQTTATPPSVTTLVNCLEINLTLNTSSRKFGIRPEEPFTFKLSYKDAFEENFEPALVWINNTIDFQKVRKDKLLLDIEISFEHLLSKTLNQWRRVASASKRGLVFTEMDLFQDFVRESSDNHPLSAALSEWLHDVRNASRDSWLSYNFDEGGQIETFSLCLRPALEHDGRKPIPYLPDKLHPKFALWKRKRLDDVRLHAPFGDPGDSQRDSPSPWED